MNRTAPCRECRETQWHAPTCSAYVGTHTSILSRHRDYSAEPPMPSMHDILTHRLRAPMKHDIGISPFVRRQTKESQYSHWDCTDEELLRRVDESFDEAKPGYRLGVILVPIETAGVYTPIVTLKSGDKLCGVYEPRVEGEEPRKSMRLDGRTGKDPCTACDVVLYHRDTLAEDGDIAEHEWSIVSVNGNPSLEEVPMDPGTIMANHFHLSGGTATGWSDERFAAELKKSVLYWRNKIRVVG